MTAPERFADSQIPLAPRAPSIHDPFQKRRVHRNIGVSRYIGTLIFIVAVFLFTSYLAVQSEPPRNRNNRSVTIAPQLRG